MSVSHQGLKLTCDVHSYANECKPFESKVTTERTAITHAREAGWVVVHIRITSGMPRLKTRARTKRVVCCPHCKWVVLP